MILIVSIVIIIISLVAFTFYRKNSDDVGLQNLGFGLSKKQKAKLKAALEKSAKEKAAREKAAREKAAREAAARKEKAKREAAAKAAKDPCEWVKHLRKS